MTIIKKIASAVLLAVTVGALSVAAQDISDKIRLNSVGLLTGFPKKASIATECTQFALRDAVAANNPIVFSARVDSVMTNTDTREQIWVANFSAFDTPGRYFIFVPGVGRSPDFTISRDVFVEPYRLLMLGMYLWRCGTAVDATYSGVRYQHAACHMEDGSLQYVGGSGTRNGTGGWHDAGDYNKYVVNSGVTVGLMLKAWEHFSPVLKDVDLIAVPNSGAIPAYLAEVKWNLDWVVKMQLSDGKVSHKMTTKDFGGDIMPETERETRYFVPWGTTATASFVAMLAQGARIYAPYAPDVAAGWLEKARQSYEVLVEHPEQLYADQTGFTTGGYETNDLGARLWAMAELWETTGEERYLNDLEGRVNAGHVQYLTEWARVQNLASMTYASSQRPGRNEENLKSVRDRMLMIADGLVSNTLRHGYGRPEGSYGWGTNGAMASTAFALNHAYRLTGDVKYRHAIQDALSNLLGRNYQGRSFVTRLGYNPPVAPHCRRSVASGRVWPGYLVGGPTTQAMEAAPGGSTCSQGATCYFDFKGDYARNEIAINWNSAMIYALSSVLPGSEARPAPCYPGQPECDGYVSVRAPTPARGAVKNRQSEIKAARVVHVQGGGRLDIPPGAKVYSLDGRLVARRKAGDADMPVIRKNGIYIIRCQ